MMKSTKMVTALAMSAVPAAMAQTHAPIRLSAVRMSPRPFTTRAIRAMRA